MSLPFVNLANRGNKSIVSGQSTFQRKRSPYVTFNFNNSFGKLAPDKHPNRQGAPRVACSGPSFGKFGAPEAFWP